MIEAPGVQEQRDFFERTRKYRRYYAERFLKIKTRDQRIIPLKYNEAQNRLLLQVEAQEKAKQPVRGICLKPRRVGLSTCIQSLMFHYATHYPNINGLTVAHDLDSTQEMFEMDGLFYDNLSWFMRPMKRYSNRKELVFENPDEFSRRFNPGLRSKLRVATSNDQELGRSKEIGLLHCSEVAFWDNAESTMLSLSNAVAGIPGTMIFKESTPNGVGNYFHREYKEAKNGNSDYFAYFMAWFEFHAHWKAVENLEAFEDSLEPEERELQKAYSLTLEQLNWRRWAIRELCGRDEDKFKQEYPSNDIECFLLSGRGVFDGKLLQRMLLAVKEPGTRGDLKDMRNHPLGFDYVPNSNGFLKIWESPSSQKRYIIGADVAEGVEGGDYSCAAVHDWDTLDLVASWHGRIATDLFKNELGRLGKAYRDALIACEDNNHGHGVNRGLLRDGYPHLYYRQEAEARSRRRQQKLGWLTNSNTKPMMLDDFQQACRDKSAIPDSDLVDEMMTFIYLDDGSMGADEGCHDDRVIASAIAAGAKKIWGIGKYFPK